jgi:uncharacterized protein (DUF2235 family)
LDDWIKLISRKVRNGSRPAYCANRADNRSEAELPGVRRGRRGRKGADKPQCQLPQFRTTIVLIRLIRQYPVGHARRRSDQLDFFSAAERDLKMLIFRGEMKNIVICFDGTWNTLDAQFPTNVIKTAQLVSPADRQGVVQAVCYDEGVGSMEVAFGNTINRLLSGAFGFGLMDNIERAYRYLTFNYTPGDRIYIFGFSRGAFSARSFAGLLRACGILRKDRLHLFGKAIETYQSRNREAGPDAVELVQFRRENSFAVYTGEGNAAVDQHPLSIEYVGVWDTVGSLGIPGNSIFASRFNRRYQFHDLALSRMVKSARHALAIDERRRCPRRSRAWLASASRRGCSCPCPQGATRFHSPPSPPRSPQKPPRPSRHRLPCRRDKA